MVVGCALEKTAGPELNASPDAIPGSVFGGQQPVTGASVSVYAVGTGGYGVGATKYATVTSDASGNFAFPAMAYNCPSSASQMYLAATGSATSSPANANLGHDRRHWPLCRRSQPQRQHQRGHHRGHGLRTLRLLCTTLGSGQVPTIGSSSTSAPGLNSAMDYTIPALVSLATGTARATATSGTLTTTTEAARIYSIANSLAACINSTGQTSTTNCGKLFGYTAPATGTRPSNAGCINTGSGCSPTSFTLSELVGAAAPTITPLGAQTLRLVSGSFTGGGVLP